MKTVAACLLVVLASAAVPGSAGAEIGTVILKMHVTNPSQKEPQTIPVKVYLPREATPKDVKDVGDLKLDFDPDTGMYFVSGEVTLEAGESVTKTVRMNDVWAFTEEQLGAFVSQAKERASKLSEPSAAQEAAGIVQRIEEKSQAILTRQKETEGKPAERIQAYRQGLTAITSIEQDLDTLDKLKKTGLQESKVPSGDADSRMPLLSGWVDSREAGASLGRTISMTTAWRIILIILGFLGALSATFFLTWHRLLRVTVVKEQEAAPLVQGDSGG
jgi:hypothetical protein